jgi:hypothetical protein
MDRIATMEDDLAILNQKETELKGALAGKEMRGLRIFSRKSEEKGTGPGAAQLKTQLLEIRKDKETLLAGLQSHSTMKKAGETWTRLKSRHQNLEEHLQSLSHKLEERHQKMTLLMRPAGDDDDQEWRSVLSDFRKTRMERDLTKAELDRQVALSGYLMDGVENAEEKVNEIII